MTERETAELLLPEELFRNLKEKEPTVHCITNFVTVNDCANIVLAAYGKPTMAHHAQEVEEITSRSGALVLNMGTLHDVDSMLLSGKKAEEKGIPVVLDPVGVGGTRLRRETYRLLKSAFPITVIRGNISEIRTVAEEAGTLRGPEQESPVGVDADERVRITESNVRETAKMAVETAKALNSLIVISGPIDIVADGKEAVLVRNGHPLMARVTGTGCMSTALIGTFLGANPDRPREAALAAVAAMGVCGELAFRKTEQEEGGTMTFRLHLIDAVSRMEGKTIREGARLERIRF